MKKQLLPKTIFHKYFNTIFKAYIRSIEQYTLPIIIIKLLNYFITLSTSLAFLPFTDNDFCLHIFTFIINFVSGKNNRNDSAPEFIVYLIFLTAFVIITFALAWYINNPKKRPTFVYNIFLIQLNILAPLFLLFGATEAGFHILSFFQPNFKPALISATVILECYVVLLIYTLQFCVNNSPPFIDGISEFFTAKMGTAYYYCMVSLRTLAAIRTTTNPTLFIVSSVISIVILLCIGLYIVFFSIFLKRDETISKSSLLSAALLYVIVSTITPIDDVISLAAYIIGFVIGMIVSTIIVKHMVKKSLAKMDAIYVKDVTFEEMYPKLNAFFFRDVRNAFSAGHEMILAAEFYEEIMQSYPVTEMFIITTMRILAIYKSQVFALEKLYSQFNVDKSSLNLKMFNKGIQKIISMRKKRENKKCKKMMRIAESAVMQNKKHLINYWKAVSECSVNEAYNFCDICCKEEELIEGIFENLIINYVSCTRIYKMYIKYLKNVSCDIIKEDRYRAILANVENARYDDSDMIECWAKKMFINLPDKVQKLDAGESVINIRDNMSISSSIQSQGFGSTSIEDDIDLGVTTNNFRETCKGIKFKTSKSLLASIVSALVLSFLVGIFILLFVANAEFSKFSNLLGFMSSFTSLLDSIPKNAYNILTDGLQNKGAINTMDREYDILFIRDKPEKTYMNILNESIKVDQFINSYVLSIPKNIKYTKDVGTLRRSANCIVNMFFKEGDQLVIKQSKYGYAAAINELSNSFLEYSIDDFNNKVDFSQEPWFLSSITNEKTICDILEKFSQFIIEDLKGQIVFMGNLSIIFPIVTTIVIFIMFCIVSYHINRTYVEYGHIIKIMSRIPSIAIIQECRRLSIYKEEEIEDDKSRGKSSVLESLSLKQGATTFKTITNLFILAMLICIAETWIFADLISSRNDALVSLPTQKYLNSMVLSKLYHQLGITRRIIAINNNHSVEIESADKLLEEFRTNLKELDELYNTYLFGRNGNYYSVINESSKLAKLYTYGHANPNITTLFEMMACSPPIQSLEVFINEMTLISEDLTNGRIVSKDNPRILNCVHYVTDYYEKVSNEANELTNAVNTIVSIVRIYSIVLMSMILIIDIIITSVLVHFQKNLENTFKYTITTLCMLDPNLYQNNDAIESLLSGDFSGNVKNEFIKIHFIKSINESTGAMIFSVDQTGAVNSPNAAAYTYFVRNKIVLLRDFIPITEEIKEVLDSENTKIYKFNHTFTEKVEDENKKTIEREYQMAVTVCSIAETEYKLVIAERDKEKEEYNELIDKGQKKLKDITHRVLPHDVRDLYTNNNTIISANDVVIVSCNLLNFQLDEEKIDDTLQFMSVYNHCVYDAAKVISDCSVVKKSGTIIFSVLNVRKTIPSISEAVMNMLKFVKALNKKCEEKEAKIAVAVNTADSIMIGCITQNTVNFNVYGREVEENYRYIRQGKESSIKMSKKIYKNLPKGVAENVVADEDGETFNLDFKFL